MKIDKLDHIGIAVKDIDQAANFWHGVLGVEITGREEVADQHVITAFLPCGESEIELLQSTSEDGPVARFINKNGEGIQHIALQVDDLDVALQEMKAKGVRLIDETPRIGAGGARIAFIHPKESFGVLVELCEKK